MRTFGRYRLLEPLASGGMADVWRAEVTLAAGVVKEVALKLVRGEHQEQGDFLRMFVEEARLACRLSHANVVQVFEFDQVDGRYYLAMELVRGRHLGQVAERARELGLRLGLPRAVHVAAEAARALAYVHRLSEGGQPLGLVHRDVSPHNLLVSFEGEVKLADFGIARAMSLAGLTEPGTLKGKIAYMAPEQARGGPVDARADVFSLGVVLWELCAGRRLFARESEAATLAAVLEGTPPSPPSAWNEDVPPALDALVLAALEREPARRTGSEELASALASLLLELGRNPADWDLRTFMHRLWPEGGVGGGRAEDTRVRPPGASTADPGPPPLAPEPAPPPGPEPTAPTRTLVRGSRAGWRALVAAVGVALALSAAGVAGLRWRRAAPEAGAPGPGTEVATGPAAGADAVPVPPAPAPPRGDEPMPAAVEAPEVAAGAPAEPSPARSEPTPPAAIPTATPAPAEQGLQAGPAGSLYVNAAPWARVTVDGHPAGETPITLSLTPGRHRIRASHPSLGARETVVDVLAGRRSSWTPNLRR